MVNIIVVNNQSSLIFQKQQIVTINKNEKAVTILIEYNDKFHKAKLLAIIEREVFDSALWGKRDN